jgi:hypothetical protein
MGDWPSDLCGRRIILYPDTTYSFCLTPMERQSPFPLRNLIIVFGEQAEKLRQGVGEQ